MTSGPVTFIVFLMSCGCYCSLPIPRGAVGWSAVCDCGTVAFPGHTHILFGICEIDYSCFLGHHMPK